MTNKEFARTLRELADIYEQNEGIPQLYTLSGGTEFVFCHSPASFAAAVAAFGSGRKDADKLWLIFRPQKFPAIEIRGHRSNICEPIVTGTKRVEEQIIPATKEQIIPAHDEEIVEYRCEPFLAEAKT